MAAMAMHGKCGRVGCVECMYCMDVGLLTSFRRPSDRPTENECNIEHRFLSRTDVRDSMIWLAPWGVLPLTKPMKLCEFPNAPTFGVISLSADISP